MSLGDALHAPQRVLFGEAGRLNSRLAGACVAAVESLCSAVACPEEAPCGGAMLRCLTDKVGEIKEPDCRKVRGCSCGGTPVSGPAYAVKLWDVVCG